jgi:uncharacterized protein YcfJ
MRSTASSTSKATRHGAGRHRARHHRPPGGQRPRQHGRGNTAATIAGSVGGALAGQELNERMNGPRYRVTLRLDSGSTLIVEDDR